MFKKMFKRFIDKAQAFRLAHIAGFIHDLASTKGGFNRKRKKRSGGRGGGKYEWGTLGLSAVSTAIRKDHGGKILPRKERKIHYYGNGKRMAER